MPSPALHAGAARSITPSRQRRAPLRPARQALCHHVDVRRANTFIEATRYRLGDDLFGSCLAVAARRDVVVYRLNIYHLVYAPMFDITESMR